MKKFVLLCLSLFFVLAVSASAALTPSTQSANLGTVGAGNTGTVTFTITADAASVGTVSYSSISFSGTGLTTFTSATTGTLPTSLVSGANTVTLKAAVPTTAGAGTYSGTLTLTDSATPANTATVTVSVTVSTTHLVEVDGGQVLVPLSYKNLQDNTNEMNITKEFTVKNTGAFTETVTLASSNLAANVKNVNFTETSGAALGTSFSLAAGASKTVKLSATLPVAFDSGISEFGKVQIGFNSGASTSTASMKVDVESMLSITDLDVTVGDEEDRGVEAGDTISEEAGLGDKIVMEFTVDNLFDDDFNDGDVSDAEIKVELDDDDFGDDIDEEEEFNVDAGKDKKDIKVEFLVPDDAEEGTYDINITVEGEDDTNSKNTHTFSMKVRLEVNLESDDVRITSVDLSPSTLQCSRDATMSVNVRNHGSNDQDEVRLQVDNGALGIDQDFEFELDEAGDDDDETRKSFSITVPQTQRAGSYPIDLRLFIDGDELEDEERETLTVQDCGVTGAEEEEEEEPPVVVTPPTTPDTSGTSPTGGAVFETVEVPFTQSPAFLALLIIGNVVVLGLIVFLAVKFAK